MVLKHVRLPLLSAYFLHDCVENQPVISQTKACQVRSLRHTAQVGHWAQRGQSLDAADVRCRLG